MGQRNGAAGRPQPGAPGRPPGTGPGGGGGFSGLLNATTPSSDLTALLTKNAGSYTWVAATVGSNNASGYQLAADEPVMAIGGFNGSDAAPTLARFKEYVAEGKIHYFLAGGTGQANSGSDYAQQITAWVASSFTARTVGGTTVYDLTAPTTS
jgi:hypothetical protein